jgi:hypothetical protein
MLSTLVLIAAVTAPGIEFPPAAAAADRPVRIDECSATRAGLDLIYRFDLSNASDKSIERVEVAFVFENPGERAARGVQRLSISSEMEAGQALRFSAETGAIRRADISRGARYGACSVVGVSFSDGTHVELAPAEPVPNPSPSA